MKFLCSQSKVGFLGPYFFVQVSVASKDWDYPLPLGEPYPQTIAPI